MAQIQTMNVSGEASLRFIEFVRLHTRNVLHFLGQSSVPSGEKPPVNLPVARMLIDQLAAISFKTRGNLTLDEEHIIADALKTLEAEYEKHLREGEPFKS